MSGANQWSQVLYFLLLGCLFPNHMAFDKKKNCVLKLNAAEVLSFQQQSKHPLQ